MNVRAANADEIDHLAKIWFDGWQDAHAQIVPAELTRLRTFENFRDRLQAALEDIQVVGPPGAPVGFCIVRYDELYQLYVSASSRGSGVAAALMADAEARLSETGVKTAWLACAIGNERAARFYEKCGWHRVGTMINQAETSSGTFPLEVWRYEKSLARSVVPQGDLKLLDSDVANRLLNSAIPARFAYTAKDGTPRVIPTWFHWNGSEVVMATFIAAPHVRHPAARLAALRANPTVAITIDTDGFPPQALLIRGQASVTEVDGVVKEYEEAARRYLGEEGADAYLGQISKPGTKMARIAVRPTWVGVLDFQTRLPSPLGGVIG